MVARTVEAETATSSKAPGFWVRAERIRWAAIDFVNSFLGEDPENSQVNRLLEMARLGVIPIGLPGYRSEFVNRFRTLAPGMVCITHDPWSTYNQPVIALFNGHGAEQEFAILQEVIETEVGRRRSEDILTQTPRSCSR